MSAPKFTKGPWAVDPLGSDWIGSVFTTDGSIQVAQAQQVKPYQEDQMQLERKANTNLIAAAPELYEALDAALAYIDACPCDPDIYPDQIAAWDRLTKASGKSVLAKARGEA